VLTFRPFFLFSILAFQHQLIWALQSKKLNVGHINIGRIASAWVEYADCFGRRVELSELTLSADIIILFKSY
jgi:hypothetical protein